MFKRELIFLALIVAIAALLFLVPSRAHATAVYPIQGKVINEGLPEIKWEDGDAGDSALGKVSYLSASKGNYLSNKEIDLNKSNLEENKLSIKVLLRLTINRMLLFLFK